MPDGESTLSCGWTEGTGMLDFAAGRGAPPSGRGSSNGRGQPRVQGLVGKGSSGGRQVSVVSAANTLFARQHGVRRISPRNQLADAGGVAARAHSLTRGVKMMRRVASYWTVLGMCVLLLGVLPLAAEENGEVVGEASNAQEVASSVAPAPLVVAVLGFQCGDEAIAGAVTDGVLATLSSDPEIELVEREQLDKVLKEYEITLSGLISAPRTQRIGFLLGAQALVTGRAFQIDDQVLITGRVVGVETGRVYVKQACGEQSAELLPLVEGLGREIACTIKSHRAALCAPEMAQDRETLMTGLVEGLKGRELPRVAISVTERHHGELVGDPAAETELMFWFNKCGFPVIATEQARPRVADWALDYYRRQNGLVQEVPTRCPVGKDVDLVIVGEAFSEFAAQVGPLTCCKVRIEVRALDPESGRVVAISRRTGTAVDVAERAAAKQGLQDSAAEVAYDMIQQLAALAPPQA
jgi:TolB-like protein